MAQLARHELAPLRIVARVLLAHITVNALLSGLGAKTLGLVVVSSLCGVAALAAALFSTDRGSGKRITSFVSWSILSASVLLLGGSLYQAIADARASSAWTLGLKFSGTLGAGVAVAGVLVSGAFLLLVVEWGHPDTPTVVELVPNLSSLSAAPSTGGDAGLFPSGEVLLDGTRVIV